MKKFASLLLILMFAFAAGLASVPQPFLADDNADVTWLTVKEKIYVYSIESSGQWTMYIKGKVANATDTGLHDIYFKLHVKSSLTDVERTFSFNINISANGTYTINKYTTSPQSQCYDTVVGITVSIGETGTPFNLPNNVKPQKSSDWGRIVWITIAVIVVIVITVIFIVVINEKIHLVRSAKRGQNISQEDFVTIHTLSARKGNVCEYCGTSCTRTQTVCSSCGGRLKK